MSMLGPYQVVYADPPWSYECKAPPTGWRPCLERGEHPQSADHYYDTMTTAEISALAPPVAADAALFLWTTNPMLPDSFDVLRAWGFDYKTCITWHKLRCKGMGYWFRGHTEHLLVAIRGKVKAFRSRQHNIVALPVHKHSEKPLRFVEIIEEVTAGMAPRLEMFGRLPRAGWDTFGNQVRSDLLTNGILPSGNKGE